MKIIKKVSITIKDKYFFLKLSHCRRTKFSSKRRQAHIQEESVAEKDNFAISLLCYRYLLQLFMPAASVVLMLMGGRESEKKRELREKIILVRKEAVSHFLQLRYGGSYASTHNQSHHRYDHTPKCKNDNAVFFYLRQGVENSKNILKNTVSKVP